MNYKQIVEGILFVSGEEGVSLGNIASALEIEKNEVELLVHELRVDMKEQNRGLQILRNDDHFQMTTLPEHGVYYQKLFQSTSNKLSRTAMETLAIIAYRQPVTRIEVEEIRGVKSERAIQSLVRRNLIKDVGRADQPGRPILYGTTRDFLDYLGLNSIKDLPSFEGVVNIEEIDKSKNVLLDKLGVVVEK